MDQVHVALNGGRGGAYAKKSTTKYPERKKIIQSGIDESACLPSKSLL